MNSKKSVFLQKIFDMETRVLNKENRDEISFMSFIIPEFAAAYKMSVQNAYRYLKQYGGLDYLHEHWWALHTDNPFWAVRDMFEICRQNGGLK
jgi:hypothetical protein